MVSKPPSSNISSDSAIQNNITTTMFLEGISYSFVYILYKCYTMPVFQNISNSLLLAPLLNTTSSDTQKFSNKISLEPVPDPYYGF